MGLVLKALDNWVSGRIIVTVLLARVISTAHCIGLYRDITDYMDEHIPQEKNFDYGNKSPPEHSAPAGFNLWVKNLRLSAGYDDIAHAADLSQNAVLDLIGFTA